MFDLESKVCLLFFKYFDSVICLSINRFAFACFLFDCTCLDTFLNIKNKPFDVFENMEHLILNLRRFFFLTFENLKRRLFI